MMCGGSIPIKGHDSTGTAVQEWIRQRKWREIFRLIQRVMESPEQRLPHLYHVGSLERKCIRSRSRSELTVIKKRREQSLRHMDYVIDVFDVLLRHIRRTTVMNTERRYGISYADAELDEWDYIGVARQETAFMRESTIATNAAVEHDEMAKHHEENLQSMLSLKSTCIALAHFVRKAKAQDGQV